MRRFFKKDKKPKTFSNNDGRPRLEFDFQKLADLKQQGKSNREIAKIFGCSEGTIRNRIREIESA